MPFVNIQMLPGRNQQQKDEMAKQIIDTISRIGKCAQSDVQVVFTEVARSDWFVGAKQQNQDPAKSSTPIPES